MVRHYTTQVPSAQGNPPRWAPQELGFDLADVSSATKLNGMPEGVDGLVYLGMRGGATEEFRNTVDRWKTNKRVWGYYIVDEPLAPGTSSSSTAQRTPPEFIKAQSDFIHEVHPGAIAYVKLTNQTGVDRPTWLPYTIENTGCDLLGVGGYSVRSRFPGGYDKDLIERYVTTAIRDGIPLAKICPYMQTFGGVPDWPLPTAAQMDEMFADWRRLCPNPVMDCCYAWTIQPQWGTQGLSNNEMMRNAVKKHFELQAKGAGGSAAKLKIELDGEVIAEMQKGSRLTLTWE